MLGPEGAAEHARAWLAERIPARLRVLEDRYDLDEGTLADPVRVLAHEVGPLAVEDWPSVFVLPQRQTGMTLIDVRDDASELYRVTYALRLVGWVRADGYAATDQLRKRYALAIREALLERKSLTPAPTYGSGDYGDTEATTVDPASLREDYSEVFTDQAKRTIAGVIVDVTLIVFETLDGPAPYGTLLTPVDVEETGDTSGIPPHPAL